MSKNYFQGKDGFIWWHGVVEDRKDPLFLGRCRVRILGWHTADKAELPTENLPWAFPIMPITSASQSGAGEAPVGPVEGTWVMGYYRDGELAQEPVMMGTMHGIPENYAKQNTGFNDSRLDVEDADRHTITIQGGAKSGGGAISLVGWPFPPKTFKAKAGKEVTITEYTNEERQALSGKSLYPRNINEPTTSRYARGEADASAKTETEGIIASKNKNLLKGSITSQFVPTENLTKNVPLMTAAPFAKLVDTSLFTINTTTEIKQPPSAYAAVYPFNHVYESESGHLIEIDDTPTKERLHWYHRSGTFTEFHPKGIRTDRTNAHRYNIVMGNQESIIGGTEKKVVENDSFTKVAKGKHLVLGNDFVVTSDNGDIILGAPSGHVVLSGQTTVIDAKNTLMLNAPTIVRSNATAVDVFKGNQTISAQGEFNVQSGKMTFGSMGATNFTSFGMMTYTVGGNSEETIANAPVMAVVAKQIKAALGKIVLETVEPTSGGIDLNVGPMGVAGQVSVATLGDVKINSNGPSGVSIDAKMKIALNAIKEATIEAKKEILISAGGLGKIIMEAKEIHLNGNAEPGVLGNKLKKALEKHTHSSSVGPTGTPLPAFATAMKQALSMKTYLG